MDMDRIEGNEDLYISGVWVLRVPSRLEKNNITHILSTIEYSLGTASNFVHLSIDLDDVEDENVLVHMPRMVGFIDKGLHGRADGKGGVLVHCAMGRSRSVTAVMAYLLWKHPARFGRGQAGTTSAQAVNAALLWVRRSRASAGPNDGFMDQLCMWCDMDCPAAVDKLERHPIYHRWVYARQIMKVPLCGRPPDTLRCADDTVGHVDGDHDHAVPSAGLEVRCKKCRRVLATQEFVVRHNGYGGGDGDERERLSAAAMSAQARRRLCPHVFVEALSWMRPVLEAGALDGRLVCPGARCGASVGRYTWRGFRCSCGEWVGPAFSLQRAKVDEVATLVAGPAAVGPGALKKESL